jgi:transcriptional regulator GlxA family with amidase domain
MERIQCGNLAQVGHAMSRHDVVERAEAYLRAHMDSPVPLSRLCRLVGRSERGLRNAFYRVHGLSPKRWMRAERLLAARNALRGGGDRSTTVTDIATDYGFYELGRFAACYKEAFGEVPSATLRDRLAVEHRESPLKKEHAGACTS